MTQHTVHKQPGKAHWFIMQGEIVIESWFADSFAAHDRCARLNAKRQGIAA